MKKRLAILAVLILSQSCAIPQGNPTPTAATPREVSTLRIYAGEEEPVLDPALVDVESPVGILISMLFTPLTEVDKDGKATPGLAESWESSQDNRVWTFHLRPNFPWVKYNPDTQKVETIRNVTAQDVEFGIRRKFQQYLDDNTAWSDTWLGFNIKGASGVLDGGLPTDQLGVRVKDDHTLEIELEQPDENLPRLGRTIFALPEETVNQYDDKWTSLENILTNGSFVPKSKTPPVGFYWGGTWLLAESGKDERVEIISGIKPEEAMEIYKKGELDVLPLQPADLPAIRQDPELSKQLYYGPRVKQVMLLFNTAKPPFDNPNLVKAFSLAIDREKLSQTEIGAMSCRAFDKRLDAVLSPNDSLATGVADWELVKSSPEAAKLALKFSGVDFTAPDTPIIRMTVSKDVDLDETVNWMKDGWQKDLEATILEDYAVALPLYYFSDVMTNENTKKELSSDDSRNLALIILYERLIEDPGALYITGGMLPTARNGQIAGLPLYFTYPDAYLIAETGLLTEDAFAREFAGFKPAEKAGCPEIVPPTSDERTDQCLDSVARARQDFEKHDCAAWIPKAQEAALLATRALDTDPNDADALLCRGEAFDLLTMEKEALADLKLARDLRTCSDEKRLDQLLKEVRELIEAPACRVTQLKFNDGFVNGKPLNPSDTYIDNGSNHIEVSWQIDRCDGICLVVWNYNGADICWHYYGNPENPHNSIPNYEGTIWWTPDYGPVATGDYTVKVICGSELVGSISGTVH